MATHCPHCQNPIAHNSALAGQNVACPYCQAAFTMPFVDATPPQPPVLPPPPQRVAPQAQVTNVYVDNNRRIVRCPGCDGLFRVPNEISDDALAVGEQIDS